MRLPGRGHWRGRGRHGTSNGRLGWNGRGWLVSTGHRLAFSMRVLASVTWHDGASAAGAGASLARPRPARPVDRGGGAAHLPAARRADPGRRIAVTIVVTAVEIAVDHLLSHSGLAPALFGALGSSGISLLGAVFLAGFLSRLVSAEHGTGQARIGDVLRSLPWGALIAADLLTALIVVVGFVLLIIPGLIALNLLVVVGR